MNVASLGLRLVALFLLLWQPGALAGGLSLCSALSHLALERAYAMPATDVTAVLGEARRTAFSDLLDGFHAARLPFLVGGDFALQAHTGLGRPTDRAQLYLSEGHLAAAQSALLAAGFSLKAVPGGLSAERDGLLVSVLFRPHPAIAPVDESWLDHARPGRLLGKPVFFPSPEESVFVLSHFLERYRFEASDVANLLHERAATLDWRRLIDRFGEDAEPLRLQLQLFRYVYPDRARSIPEWVMPELSRRNAPEARREVLSGAPLRAGFDMEREITPSQREAYRGMLGALNAADVPYLVGGTFAVKAATGLGRPTKDFDIFIREADLPRALRVLGDRGYRTEIPFPHWLAKAHAGREFMDLIFNSGNKLVPVDGTWFGHATTGTLFGMPVRYTPLEESLRMKAFLMDRERFDGHDIAALIAASGGRLDWRRLIDGFGRDWEVLEFHLAFFQYTHPRLETLVPEWVTEELRRKTVEKYARPETWAQDVCYGTRVSRGQYLGALQWGYRDARLPPEGNMSRAEIDAWTEAIHGRK